MPVRGVEKAFQPRDNNHFHISTFSEAALAQMGPVNFRGQYRSVAQQMIGATVRVGERTFQIIETWGFKGEKKYGGLYGQTPGTVYANPNMGSHLALVRVGEPGEDIGDCVLIRGMQLTEGPDITIKGKGIKPRSVTDAPGSVAKVMDLTLNGQRKTLRVVDARARAFELVDYTEENTTRRES